MKLFRYGLSYLFLVVFITACGGGGGGGSTNPPPVANQPPTIAIQSSYDVDAGTLLSITSTASDPDGQVNSIDWEVVSGPISVNLVQTSGEQISVEVPGFYCDVAVTIRVTVTDNQSAATTAETVVRVNPLPRLFAEEGSSYSAELCAPHIDRAAVRTVSPGNFSHAITYADFDDDGITDVFVASGNSQTRTPFELYLGDGTGQYQYTQALFGDPNLGQIHPRRAITSDFNADGRPDVFVIAHGVDMDPFPGEYAILLVSSNNQLVPGQDLSAYVEFLHGGAAADMDLDSDMDIVVVAGGQAFFLLNDGTGTFEFDQSRVPTEMIDLPAYSAELLDLDADGFVDLLSGGHEFEGMPTVVYWGDGSGDYSNASKTILPVFQNYGVALDYDAADLDGNGLRDLIVTRAGGGNNNFYVGFAVQYLELQADRSFLDKSAAISDSTSDTESWFDYIRITDIDWDADLDVVVDDAGRNIVWLNDGLGNLVR